MLKNTNPIVAERGNTTESGLTARAFCGAPRAITNTISSVMYVFLCLIAFDAFANVTFDESRPTLVVQRLEKYKQQGLLSDIYSFRTKTQSQIIHQIEALMESGHLRQDDRELFEDYLELNKRQGWQVYTHLHSDVIATNADSSPTYQTDARANLLTNINDGARFMESGIGASLEPRLILQNDKFVSIDLWPRITLNADGDADLSFFQYALKVGVGNFEVAVGKLYFQWGQGEYSRMLYGGSQRAIPMVRLQNVEPIELGGMFSFLGKGKFTFFMARMDDDQILAGSTLIGERLAFEINPNFEFGISQSIQIGGDGYPDLPWYENVLEVMGLRLNPDDENFTNRNAQLDFRLRLPKANDLQLYGELFFEDCCTINFDKNIGNALGIEIPDLGDPLQTRLVFEHIRATFVYNRHSEYRSGFIYDGISIGHPIGADSQGYYMFADQILGPRITQRFALAFEIRQVREVTQNNQDIRIVEPTFEKREYRYRALYQTTWAVHKSIQVGVELGYERVNNFQYIQSQDENFFLARTRVDVRF